MKKFRNYLLFASVIVLLSTLSVTQQSCSRGYGCETEEYSKRDVNEQMNKANRGKSNLFPKRMRKKMSK